MTEGSWAESPLTVVVAPLVQSYESKSFDSLALFCPAVDYIITSWLEFGPRDIWMCPLSCNNLEDVLLRCIQLCFILRFGRVTLHFHLFHFNKKKSVFIKIDWLFFGKATASISMFMGFFYSPRSGEPPSHHPRGWFWCKTSRFHLWHFLPTPQSRLVMQRPSSKASRFAVIDPACNDNYIKN